MTAPDLPALLVRCESAAEDSFALFQIECDLADLDPSVEQSDTHRGIPPYLRSIDAAVAFFEAVLPGWDLHAMLIQEKCKVVVQDGVDGDIRCGAYASSLPLAIICATLKALIAKGESDATRDISD